MERTLTMSPDDSSVRMSNHYEIGRQNGRRGLTASLYLLRLLQEQGSTTEINTQVFPVIDSSTYACEYKSRYEFEG
jgi:hypothetical protein